MSVRTILRNKGSDVITVGLETTLQHAALVMSARNVGSLVVTDNDRIVGLLTHRDVVNGLAHHGERFASVRVKDAMKETFVSVTPEETAKRVMSLMTLHRVTHIPVLDGDRLAGIVSIGDIVKDRLGDLELETSVLRDAYIARH